MIMLLLAYSHSFSFCTLLNAQMKYSSCLNHHDCYVVQKMWFHLDGFAPTLQGQSTSSFLQPGDGVPEGFDGVGALAGRCNLYV